MITTLRRPQDEAIESMVWDLVRAIEAIPPGTSVPAYEWITEFSQHGDMREHWARYAMKHIQNVLLLQGELK
jgi:hypothetical protein